MPLVHDMREAIAQWSIKKQMTVVFVTVAMLAVLLIVALAMGNQAVMSDNAERVATRELEKRMEASLTATVAASAVTIERKLLRVENGIIGVVGRALTRVVDVGAGAYPLDENTILPSNSVDNSAPNLDQELSLYAAHTDTDVVTGNEADVRDLVSRVKDIFVGSHHTSDLPVSTYFCAAGPPPLFFDVPANNRSSRDYLPTGRTWYKDAMAAGDAGPVYGDPYVDASGNGIVVTLSDRISTRTEPAYGVLAVDITIQTILELVLSLTFLECEEGSATDCEPGYAALFMQHGTHAVVAHPADGAMPDPALCSEAEHADKEECQMKPISAFEDLDVDWDTVAVEGGEVESDGRLVVFAPVLNVFTVMASVPLSRLQEPVDDLQSSMDSTRDNVIIAVVVVSIVTIVVAVGMILYLARRIAERMEFVRTGAHKIMENLAQGRALNEGVDDHVGGQVVQDEIQNMAAAFTQMVRAVAEQQAHQEPRFVDNPFHGNSVIEMAGEE